MRQRLHFPKSLAVFVALAFVLAGCASTGGATIAPSTAGGTIAGASEVGLRLVADLPPPANTAGGTQQVISANDVVRVRVFQVSELDTTAQVDSGGQIFLPLIGAVQAGGKSVRTLQSEITQRYASRYLQNPQVTVSIEESVGQRVTVDGEFNRVGLYPVTTQTGLLQVIAQAGGLSRIADSGQIFVFRDVGGETYVAQFDVNRIRSGQQRDPRIFGGDVVIAFASGTAIMAQNLREAFGLAASVPRLGF